MSEEDTIEPGLQLFAAILTAEVFNRTPQLDANDLPPVHRRLFGINGGIGEVKRPVVVSEGALQRVLGIAGAYEHLKNNPFIGYEEFGQRFTISALEPAARWFFKMGGEKFAVQNPTLACIMDSLKIGPSLYTSSREMNPPIEDSRSYLDSKVEGIIKHDETMKGALDLVIVSAADEIEQSLETLVCTPEQIGTIAKIRTAVRYRGFLQEHGIYELGKLLFVGPPGTGKTSLALALSHELHMPVLEVRLSMITSQYLGETSKNIDRIFQFAKKMAPCILFIDEFDFIAKSRVTDDHGAMKRAVNMILKNIDRISLVRDRVLLIGATNHPQLLDEAAWRRFDDILEFTLPDAAVRKNILERLLSQFESECDPSELAAQTDGFSGADLRIMVKEGVLTSLARDSPHITRQDIEKGLMLIRSRNAIRRTE